jgi:hypothetical protein
MVSCKACVQMGGWELWFGFFDRQPPSRHRICRVLWFPGKPQKPQQSDMEDHSLERMLFCGEGED